MSAPRRCGFTAGVLLATLMAGSSVAVGAIGVAAQEVAVGVDTARVGDVVPVAVRMALPPGERVLWPDTLPLGRVEAENARRVREQVDTLDDGRLARTGVYAVTPWATGEVALPEIRIQVVGGGESPRSIRVTLPSLTVASVLPPDTAGLDLRPARDVIGADWAWGPLALLALLAAAALALAVWWWRRRGDAAEPAVPSAPLVPPRERALAALQEARDAGLVEAGEMKRFYTLWSEAVREYAAALNGGWGEDLTTTELLGRFRSQAGPAEAAALGAVLAPADQVKFARRRPGSEEAVSEWEAARAWVVAFQWPPRRAVSEEAA